MELSDRDWTEPSTTRLPLHAPHRDAIVLAHARAIEADDDGYDDPATGLYVFTAKSLATRDCCDLGCRHCPYCD
ncbi:MAG: DUF5522 domain-containing protein [Candidatus Nanopelagicales bacterium]